MLTKIPRRLIATTQNPVPELLKTIYYSEGDLPKPATNPQYLRVYGHNLCPYVERSVLSLRAKQIDF